MKLGALENDSRLASSSSAGIFRLTYPRIKLNRDPNLAVNCDQLHYQTPSPLRLGSEREQLGWARGNFQSGHSRSSGGGGFSNDERPRLLLCMASLAVSAANLAVCTAASELMVGHAIFRANAELVDCDGL